MNHIPQVQQTIIPEEQKLNQEENKILADDQKQNPLISEKKDDVKMIVEEKPQNPSVELSSNEEKYPQEIEKQLAILSDMGFQNRKLNAELLIKYGDLAPVVDELI